MARPYQDSSSAIVIGMKELERLQSNVRDLARALPPNSTLLADRIGQQQEDSARRRIRETKRSPAGKKWKPWSKPYAKTRGPQHSLLVGEGHLADSMTHVVLSPEQVAVGSNLNYASAMLFGVPSMSIPAREYLDTGGGFADPHDRAEIRDILRDLWNREVLK
jgi:phage virion morphogenesis protein